MAPTAFSTVVQRRGQFVARRDRPVVAAPGSAFGVLLDVSRGVFQAFEEFLPLGIDRAGVLFIAGVEIVDVGSIGALQKGREGKCCVRVLARHDGVLVIFGLRIEDGASPIRKPDQRDKYPLPYLMRNFAPKRTKN